MKSELTKENIIQQTILLIEESNGVIENITIRTIAERAGVGIGLINHYFETKDKLIEICVQRIIGEVVHTFRSKDIAEKTPPEVTKHVAKQVMDFLMDNMQISKVSILGDLKNPREKDNSMGTASGFAHCMSGGITPEKHIKKAFYLVAILQESFIRKDTLLQNIGVDFFDKEQRDCYVDEIVEMIMR